MGLERESVALSPALIPVPAATRPLWRAESLGTVFEANRVRRISRAQDALSPAEERVYNLLWGTRNLERDEFRLVHYSLQRIAAEASLNIKTVRELLPRLIDKGFVEVAHEADPRRNQPTLYRVWSYVSVLARQRAQQRFHVVKTGKGVFYAHPVSATLSTAPETEPPSSEPMGLESPPMGLKPPGFSPEPMGLDPNTLAPAPSAPMGATGPKPMGPGGTLSKDTSSDKLYSQTSSSAYRELLDIIRQGFAVEPDSHLIDQLLADCHQAAQTTTGEPASDQELLHFARSKVRVLARAPNIRNHLAVLRKALPECFSGDAFRVYRQAQAASADACSPSAIPAITPEAEHELLETERRLARWSQISERHRTPQGLYNLADIAADPDLDPKGRDTALALLQRAGKFSPSGL